MWNESSTTSKEIGNADPVLNFNMIQSYHQTIFADINECLTNSPCQNGSTCVNNNGGYQCLCVPGLTGLHCDQGR